MKPVIPTTGYRRKKMFKRTPWVNNKDMVKPFEMGYPPGCFYKFQNIRTPPLTHWVNSWSLLFQKGTQRWGFAFFQLFLGHFVSSIDMAMMYICFFISRTFLTKLWKRIFDLRSQKIFLSPWSSRVDKVLVTTVTNLIILFGCHCMEFWKSAVTSFSCLRIVCTWCMML